VEADDVEDDEVKGEEDDDVENDDVEDEDRSQDREPFTGKCRRPRPGTHTLRASLRSRNALQHFTRATYYRNEQEKCRGPD